MSLEIITAMFVKQLATNFKNIALVRNEEQHSIVVCDSSPFCISGCELYPSCLMEVILFSSVDTFAYCRYHPDKNANDPKAADMFKEVTFSYNILSDPDKKRQYDSAGFEVVFFPQCSLLGKNLN